MVGLAVEETKGKEARVMILNGWADLPVVVVTAPYLKACQTKMSFLEGKPNIDSELKWNPSTLVQDCASPDESLIESEIGEEGYFRDGFGLEFSFLEEEEDGL